MLGSNIFDKWFAFMTIRHPDPSGDLVCQKMLLTLQEYYAGNNNFRAKEFLAGFLQRGHMYDVIGKLLKYQVTVWVADKTQSSLDVFAALGLGETIDGPFSNPLISMWIEFVVLRHGGDLRQARKKIMAVLSFVQLDIRAHDLNRFETELLKATRSPQVNALKK